MKKSIFALSVAALFSISSFASDHYILSDPEELLPGEDVKNFATIDLNGDGIDELVFVTASGQLKYSRLLGAIGGGINESSFESLKGKEFLMNVLVKGDTGNVTKIGIDHEGVFYVDRARVRKCTFHLSLQGDKISGTPSDNRNVELTLVTDDLIAGKMKCLDYLIHQSKEIAFTAKRI
ncbi:hypothetical protein ACXAAV_21620 [Vibrio coralliilyticus]